MSRPSTVARVVAVRRAGRRRRLERATAYVEGLDPALHVRAACVVGSVARGDWNDMSDIDVLVVADRLPDRASDRLAAIGAPAAGGIQALAWTPAEWRNRVRRQDPAAVEAVEHGVWLVGSRALLDELS